MQKDKKKELMIFSKQIQMKTIETIASIGIGHVGGALSIADLLAVLYGKQMKIDPGNPKWEDRDWLVVSKGHAGPAVYSALALKGYFPTEQLYTLNQCGTHLPSHCDRNLTTGIDITTGSLGQGASSAAGAALGLKMSGKDNFVYLVLGDGEIEEGQVWEMAMFAAAKKLGNLIAFVDNNKLQIDGEVDTLCALGDIALKFEAFGWNACTVDGHNVESIDAAIEEAKKETQKPSMIVLDTIKGKGWSEIEGKVGSHSRTINGQDKECALKEMREALKAIEEGDVE